MFFESCVDGSLECVFPTRKCTDASKERKILVNPVETSNLACFSYVSHSVRSGLKRESLTS